MTFSSPFVIISSVTAWLGAIICVCLHRVGWGKAPPLRSQRPTAEYIAHNKELSNAHKEAYEGNIKNDKIIIPSYLLRYYER